MELEETDEKDLDIPQNEQNPTKIFLTYKNNEEEIRLFGEDFIQNNKGKCKIKVGYDKKKIYLKNCQDTLIK